MSGDSKLREGVTMIPGGVRCGCGATNFIYDGRRQCRMCNAELYESAQPAPVAPLADKFSIAAVESQSCHPIESGVAQPEAPAPNTVCTCIKEGSGKCKYPHPCRQCGSYHPGVSCYWHAQGKTPADKKPGGRTFVNSGKTLGCAECCFGDRCDDPRHYERDSCPYCLGSGTPAAPSPSPSAEANGEILDWLRNYARSQGENPSLISNRDVACLAAYSAAKDAQIAALTKERDEARKLIPHEGDGSCDHCGKIPSVDIPTRLCDECVDGVKRAEAAEAENQKLREALTLLLDRLDKYCGVGKYKGEPYEVDDCPHEFIGLETMNKIRALLSPAADTPVSELPNVAAAGLTPNGKRLLIPIRITDLHGQGLGCVLPRGEAIEIEQSLVPVGKHYILAHELFEVVCQRLLDAKAITEKPPHDFIDQCSGMLFMTIAMSGLWKGVTPDQAQQFFEYLERQPNGKIVAAADTPEKGETK